MRDLNDIVYTSLEFIHTSLTWLGLPIAALAWLAALSTVIFLAYFLWSQGFKGNLGGAMIVGGLSLVAHQLDYTYTLAVMPVLKNEMNPLWQIVLNAAGLPVAQAYGLSSKILLAALSFELYAFYAVRRTQLFPREKVGLLEFFRTMGSKGDGKNLASQRLINLFAFCFACCGPFTFYVVLHDMVRDPLLAVRLPAIPLVLLLWIGLAAALYVAVTYRAYLRWYETSMQPVEAQGATGGPMRLPCAKDPASGWYGHEGYPAAAKPLRKILPPEDEGLPGL